MENSTNAFRVSQCDREEGGLEKSGLILEGNYDLLFVEAAHLGPGRLVKFSIRSPGIRRGKVVNVPLSASEIAHCGEAYVGLTDALGVREGCPIEDLPRVDFSGYLYNRNGVQGIRPRLRDNVVDFPTQTPPARTLPRVESAHKLPEPDRAPECAANLPGVLGEIARAITETAPLQQHELSGLAAISFAATVMGQRYVGPTGLATNLYLLGVAPSGSGKDRPLKSVMSLLEACSLAQLACDEPASGSALLTRLGDYPNTVMVIDEFGKFARAIVEQKAGAHMRDIGTHFLKLTGEPMPLYSGRMYADPSARKTSPIRYPCLNILGATTPTTYYSCLSREQVEEGLLGRVIPVTVPNTLPPPNPCAGPLVVPSTVTEWARVIRSRMPLDPLSLPDPSKPFRVSYADQRACSVIADLDAYARRAWDELVRSGSGLEALTRRWVEWALKLAVVAAGAVDPREPVVTHDIAEWAAGFAVYHGNRGLEAIRSQVVESPFDAQVRDCTAALERAGAAGLTSRQLADARAFRKLTPTERRAVVDHLKQAEIAWPKEGGGLVLLKHWTPPA